jgi:hypothetical protein
MNSKVLEASFCGEVNKFNKVHLFKMVSGEVC